MTRQVSKGILLVYLPPSPMRVNSRAKVLAGPGQAAHRRGALAGVVTTRGGRPGTILLL